MTEDEHSEKVAIVTGASRGFGRAVAAELRRAGWEVMVDARDPVALGEAARAVGAHHLAGDVDDPAHRAELIDGVAAAFGRLDLLVNNAGDLGVSPLPHLSDYPLDALRRLLDVNVVAQIGLLQLALPLLRRSRGAIVNVTSDAAVEPYPGWGGYGLSKAALEQASAVLAAEEPEVSVWWLDPGDMRTRMHQDAFPGEDIGDRPVPEAVAPAVLRLVERRPPSGRVRAGELLASDLVTEPGMGAR
jgi:NAD(P)-dependent dehydrogenase (short-subunit alcohol dehydrogenase family)